MKAQQHENSGPALATSIARHVWETRYRWVREGVAREDGIEDSWLRVARAAAAPEGSAQPLWQNRFYGLLRDFRFLPGGRILAGAGTGLKVTLFNCFVMGRIEDDLGAIFERLREGALTMQAGGGVGYDFSPLRPRGTPAASSGNIASGPVSFMEIWNAACATLLSTGWRRGAMMATLRCDHPDIEDFIEAKHRKGTLTHFNLSVQVSDDFMRALARGDDWPLVFPLGPALRAEGREVLRRRLPGGEAPVDCAVLARRPAAELWRRLMRAAYETAEPGVLFIDRINALNNLGYRETISCTNPCGEIPLPPYGACNLGSINLTRFVRAPFTPQAAVDLEALRETAALAVRFLDNIIDCSEFPLHEQAVTTKGSRRIGLGITGLADALVMLGLHYASAEARERAAAIMRTICHAAYECSADLAREKGVFPWYDREAYAERPFIRALPAALRDRIARQGMRNSHLTAIAPAGTISLLAGNVSSGMEPVFAPSVRRRVLGQPAEARHFDLEDQACRLWRESGGSGLPPGFVSARELDPREHLTMQEVLQQYVDNSISKTINVPEDYPFEDFQQLYREAWERGLKGCTAYRPTPLRGAVLQPCAAPGDSRAEE